MKQYIPSNYKIKAQMLGKQRKPRIKRKMRKEKEDKWKGGRGKKKEGENDRHQSEVSQNR